MPPPAPLSGDKYRILVLGGVGFVGRHFVKFCVDNDLCSKIRVVDKTMPAISYFTPAFAEAFANPVVEYKQADLTKPASVTRVFEDTAPWDFVFNLAAETKFGMEDEVYRQKCYELAMVCGREAAARGVQRFIEVSDARIYAPKSKASDEAGKTAPWTKQAQYKLQAETELREVPNLPLIVLRPAIIYGPSDVTGLMPRIVCAAVYKKLNETMKFLWGSSLKYNSVHVTDVCRALWHVALNAPVGSTFNLADKTDLDQGKFNVLLSRIFGIETGFHGTILSNMARVALGHVCDEANEKHLNPWTELLKEANIANTPLTPYVDKELLYDHHLSVDGSRIEAETGFTYSVPLVTEETLREVVNKAVEQGIFPSGLC